MTSDNQQPTAAHPGHEQPQQGPEVTITIDNNQYAIHRGRQTVAALKALAGVSQSYDLAELEDGRLVSLPDDGAVTIKGGEVFKSNLKVGHSS
jgi:hypothetical protein